MKIESVYHLKQVVSSGKFADGGVLSHEAVKNCWPEVADAVDNPRQDPQWGDAADYPLGDWQYEVANGYTRLGYWDWVALQREMED